MVLFGHVIFFFGFIVHDPLREVFLNLDLLLISKKIPMIDYDKESLIRLVRRERKREENTNLVSCICQTN